MSADEWIRVRELPHQFSAAALETCTAEGLQYGPDGGARLSLVRAAVEIDKNLWDGFIAACSDLLNDIRQVYVLYREALENDLPLAALLEQGLDEVRKDISRAGARADQVPKMCRLDVVADSSGPRVAEVQWSSGGPGFFLGLAKIFRDHDRSGPDPIEGVAGALAETGGERIINLCRDSWLPGERMLQRELDRLGVNYHAVDRTSTRQVIHDQLRTAGSGRTSPLVVYGQGYTEELESDQLRELAARCYDGSLWLEIPPIYALRQKVWQALPFDERYASRFSASAREAFVPTFVAPDERGVMESLSGLWPAIGATATRPTSVDGLCDLPESARKKIIVKCAAGVGGYHSNGRGVFRLSGSRAAAKRVGDLVAERQRAGEPWVLQPLMGQRFPVPLPADTSEEIRDASLRLLVFLRREGAQWRSFALLANFGTHWKVSGKSGAVKGNDQSLGGFGPVRVTRFDNNRTNNRAGAGR